MSVNLYDIKEFLTLDDVADYLADKCSYDFNLESSIDQNRLIETIIQLVRSRKLNPVFHYIGSVDWLEKKVITRKSGRFNNHEIVLTDIKYDMRVNDYYFVSDRNFNRLIENNCSNYINIINCTIEPYHVDGKQEIVENKILDYRKVKEDYSITFHDLLYPKLDLDKLFSQTEADADTIEKLKEQIADLENQLAQAKAEPINKPADDKDLTPKDSAYCLIAVLKDLLLNPDISAYHFKNDSENSSNKPSQTGLSSYIDEMKIFGIKKDNINILFQDANKKLKDVKKKS